MASVAEGDVPRFSFVELFGEKLAAKKIDKFETVDTKERLDGKYVLMYFSAHWCPPCRAFTPVLRQFYLTQRAKGRDVEVVFVSMDNSKAEFEDYYLNHMPGVTFAWDGNADRRARLSRKFQVLGIPCLVIIRPDGTVANRNARAALVKDLDGKKFPWVGEEDRSLGMGWMPVITILILVLMWYYFNNN